MILGAPACQLRVISGEETGTSPMSAKGKPGRANWPTIATKAGEFKWTPRSDHHVP